MPLIVRNGVGFTTFVARSRILMRAVPALPCSAIKSRVGSVGGAVTKIGLLRPEATRVVVCAESGASPPQQSASAPAKEGRRREARKGFVRIVFLLRRGRVNWSLMTRIYL